MTTALEFDSRYRPAAADTPIFAPEGYVPICGADLGMKRPRSKKAMLS